MEEQRIKIDKEDFKILKQVLKKHPYKFYVYGSRVQGKSKIHSDIDLYCKDKMKEEDMMNLKWDLEESDISIKVDIIDAHSCSEEFRKLIKQDLVEIK